ncbi:MAG: glycosyltransferase family A protein [Acidobacteria bacterium]|nr:glycosyltransferase family A protein [Acidobacteriota bacterium]
MQLLSTPELSVVLATDTYATIRPVVDRFRRQTIHDRIELILIAPSADNVNGVFAHRDEFAAIQIVEDPVVDLAPARAAGIRAASAPYIFVGETHSYPHPEFAEALVRRLSESWTAVAPAFGNANPNGPLSWAGFISDYGRWVEGTEAGEASEFPIYNVCVRRDALLALGDRLGPALAHGDEWSVAFHSAGHRAYLEPGARLDHVNVAPLGNWIRERILAGMLIANHRASRWSLARRIVYFFGSPLLPLVFIARVLPGVRRTVSAKNLPVSVLFWIAFGMTIKSMGEMVGYAGWPVDSAEKEMHEYEVHKLKYAGRMAHKERS